MSKIKLKEIKIVNVSAILSKHLIGPEYTPRHHMIIGSAICIVGVFIVKLTVLMSSLGIVHFIGETVGYVIHGVGAVPFVDHFLNKKE